MLVHCIIWLVIGSAIYLNAVWFCPKLNKWGGTLVRFTILDTDWLLVMWIIWGVWKKYMLFCLFDSLHSINNLSDIKWRVYLGWTSVKLGLMCLAQRHNAVVPVSIQPAAPRSRVKHSTTETLHQQITEEDPNLKLWNTTEIFIKMSIIYLWCNDASWLLILCAL